jgi:hypothetical protein
MSKTKGPKILYLDIECSQTVYQVYHYTGRDVGYLSHKDILHPWYITCAAWAWLDNKKGKIGKVTVSKVSDFEEYDKDFRNDLGVIEELIEVMQEADLIVGHNVANFDLRKINTRLIFHGLPSVDLPPVVDTLKAAKKYTSFQSKSLAYLAKVLDCEHQKIELKPGTMHKADRGCEKSLKELADYNVGDIKSGASVYFKLLPYIKNHPNLNRVIGRQTKATPKEVTHCGSCGSSNIKKWGSYPTKTGPVKRLICNDCGSSVKGGKK